VASCLEDDTECPANQLLPDGSECR
jgi:hypothetical protein